MDTNNWRPTQGGEPGIEAGDWRSQLQPDSRQRIVNKIMETLEKHLPVSGNEGLSELRKIAVRFEEKIYTAATAQSDYLRKISLKMLAMETESQNPVPSNSMVPGNKPLDSSSQNMQSPVLNQGQSISVPLSSNQPQSREQLLPQNIQNNIASQSSSSLSSAVPPVAGLASSSMPNMVGQNPSIQNVSGVPQNSVGQGVPSNVFPNSQRPIQGRQVVPQQQQQQSQTQQQQQQQSQTQQQQQQQQFIYQQQNP